MMRSATKILDLLEKWADDGWTVNLEYLQSRSDSAPWEGGWSCEVYETTESPMPGAYVEGRGYNASAMINLDRAKSLHAWLGRHIEKAEQIAAQREKAAQKKTKV